MVSYGHQLGLGWVTVRMWFRACRNIVRVAI